MKRKMLVLFTVSVLVPVFLSFAAEDSRGVKRADSVANTGRRVALVIGNGNYKIGMLKNPANDARLITDSLKKLGFEVLYGDARTDLDFAGMNRAVDDFGKSLRNAEVALFFYSGHGVQYRGRNYLIPVNADIQDGNELRFRAVDAGLVLAKMESAGTVLNLVVLDACRNNPFAKSWRSAENGLAKMEAPEGTKIIYAASPGGVAADGDGNNSPFSESLSRHMLTPGMEVEKVIRNVALDVKRETKGRQLPWAEGILLGDFYFAASSGYQEEERREPPPVPPAEPGPGVLKVVLKPNVSGARVKVNGNDYGEQREFTIKQKSTYTVEVSASGYETYRTEAEAGPGFAKTVTALLEKESVPVPVPPPAPVSRTDRFTNSIGQDFVYIKPGTFMMGSPENEPGRYGIEKQHQVTLTKGFYMQTTEVTVGQWQSFAEATDHRTDAEKEGWSYGCKGGACGKQDGYYWDSPGFSQTEKHPVTCVSWNDVQAFLKWLKQKEGKQYRLPTEAEWEYAARAGTQTARYWGNSPDQACGYANVADKNAKRKYPGLPIHDCEDGYTETAPVRTFRSNAFGLYDMIGNVWEWCQDWHGDYPAGSVTDPEGPGTSSYREVRGGCWNSGDVDCRSANRFSNTPSIRGSVIGFRLVLSVGQQ